MRSGYDGVTADEAAVVARGPAEQLSQRSQRDMDNVIPWVVYMLFRECALARVLKSLSHAPGETHSAAKGSNEQSSRDGTTAVSGEDALDPVAVAELRSKVSELSSEVTRLRAAAAAAEVLGVHAGIGWPVRLLLDAHTRVLYVRMYAYDTSLIIIVNACCDDVLMM